MISDTKGSYIPYDQPWVTVKRPTCQKAAVQWCLPPDSEYPVYWLVMLDKLALDDSEMTKTCFFFIEGHKTRIYLPFSLTAGSEYTVSVAALSHVFLDTNVPSFLVFDDGTTDFRAELTLNDLRALYTAARKYCDDAAVTPCNWLYRNKPVSYYKDVMTKHRGLMRAYIKDHSGDQASPINGQLDGLFFMANNVNGIPPSRSPFGPRRFQVPAEFLLESAPNVYFVDFYCMRGCDHYITLVATCPGSDADQFCSRRLLPVDLYDSTTNPFLFWDHGCLYVTSDSNLQVELFYTEDIDVYDWMIHGGAKMVDVTSVCKGSSTPGGVPKNPNCTVCNLKFAYDCL